MDTSFVFVVGSAPIDNSLEFVARSVVVDNPTNQWIRLDSLGIFIPQYTLGATYPLPGTTRAQASFRAPIGQVEPPVIAAQAAAITFNSLPLPSSSGVGMLGGRAPYYDRNPLSLVFGFNTVNVAPHALTTRWTYTVPAGRRAYLEEGQVYTVLEAAGDLAVTPTAGFSATSIAVTPVAGGIKSVVLSNVQDMAPPRSWSGAIVGVSMELQPGEVVSGLSKNVYTATPCTHYVTAKVTEFDM